MNDEDFDRACQFLNTLAAALQRYGVSSRGMESLLARVARALHLRGEFQATPTQVQSIIWTDENRQRLHVTVSSAGNYDLTRLAQITELVGQVESGAIAPGVGFDRLRVIESGASRSPGWLDAVGFALCAVGFGVILGLSWRDVVLGGALSLVAFGFNRLAADSQGLANALEVVVASIVSALATLLCLVFPGSNPLGVSVSALIYFVPGFGLTLGANELMNGNTLSGLLGFTRAVVTSVKLLVGALIGAALVRSQVTVPVPSGAPGVPHVWTWLFVPDPRHEWPQQILATDAKQDGQAEEPTLSGAIFQRQAQIRWTQPVAGRLHLDVAIEDPSNRDAISDAPVMTPSRLPDVIAGTEVDWARRAHVRVTGIYRRVTAGDLSANGWALSTGAYLSVFGTDKICGSFSYGEGVGRYLLGMPGTFGGFVDSDTGELNLIAGRGGLVTYRHTWSRNIRSTAGYGRAAIDRYLGAPDDEFRRSAFVLANLMMSPLPYLTYGFEYQFGAREAQDGSIRTITG